jgi:hypothetical protein
VSCKVMAPFTPFFTEVLYQNLRKVSNGSEESIHYCKFPQEEGTVWMIFIRAFSFSYFLLLLLFCFLFILFYFIFFIASILEGMIVVKPHMQILSN